MSQSDIAVIGFKAQTTDITKADKQLESLGKTGDKTDSKLNTLVKTVGVLGAALVALGSKQLLTGIINETKELETSMFRVQALLKSTGKSALITSEELRESAASLALVTLGNTKEILKAQEIMLTFKKISVESYDEVIETALNLSAVTGQSVTAAMLQLGKALEDPVTGMSAMSRSGVSFSIQQKETAKALVATNDTLGAQRLILDELASQYGGTARAAAEGLEGAQDTLGQAIEELNLGLNASLDLNTSLISSYGSLSDSIFDLSRNTDSLIDGAQALATVIALGSVPSISRYVISLAVAAKAQLLVGTTATKTANALGVVTTTAASATVATNALGVATRFLLGPWGLLITAVTVGASVFMSSREQSDLLKKSLGEQKTIVDELTESYNKQGRSATGKAYVEAQMAMIKIDTERYEIQQKLAEASKPNANSITGFANVQEVANLTGQLKDLDERAETAQASLTAINGIFENGLNAIEWVDPVKEAAEEALKAEMASKASAQAFEKQMQSLVSLREQIGMTSDELVIYNATQQAAAGNYTPEQTKAVIAQAEAYVKARKEYKAFQDEFGGQDMMSDDWMQDIKTMGNPFEDMIGGAKDALSATSGLFESGSKDAKKMAVALSALNLIAGVQAVLTQGQGDPYTAFGRMAAMAGMVASLGVSIGSLNGGFDDVAGDRQETQGLTIWGDKSESISNSIDITADATSELVGINKGMLNALTTLQSGIAGVSSMATRGLADISLSGSDLGIIDFAKFIADPMEMIGLGFLGDFIGKAIGKYFGGSSKTVDSGISFGGSLTGDADIMGYQTTQYKKWKWGSKKTREDFYDLGDDINTQFGLALMGIADSVAEGAMALGFSTDYITDKINAFEVESQKISLKGLSAEEQAAEIEAVFSSIFDNVAGEVIPFLGDFQQVGEGLAETLVRVATQVQITEVLADKLGVTIADKLADPQMFAQIADNLSTLVGGIEEFASKTSSFIDSFAPEAVKFDIASEGLTAALKDVGLTVPDTADGFWDLMDGLNANTSAGQAQIAALLNAQGIAGDYYDLLEARQEDALQAELDIANARQDELDSFNSSLISVSSSIEAVLTSMFGGASQATAIANLDKALGDARRGDFSTAISFDPSSIATNKSDFASLGDYNASRGITGNKLKELADLTGSQKTTEEMALSESIEQSKSLRDLNEKNQELSDKITQLTVISKKTADQLQQYKLDSLPVRIVE